MITLPGRSAVSENCQRDRLWRRLSPAAIVLTVLGVAALLFAGGCASVGSRHRAAKRDTVFVPANFTGVPRLPATLRRVVLLPVGGTAGVPAEALASFDPVMAVELQRTARFEVVIADSAALVRLCDRPRVLSVDALPPGFLSLLAREYDADAVMFVDITALSSYQPLSLGLRAKLAATDGTILWAFDTLFATSDPRSPAPPVAMIRHSTRRAIPATPATRCSAVPPVSRTTQRRRLSPRCPHADPPNPVHFGSNSAQVSRQHVDHPI